MSLRVRFGVLPRKLVCISRNVSFARRKQIAVVTIFVAWYGSLRQTMKPKTLKTSLKFVIVMLLVFSSLTGCGTIFNLGVTDTIRPEEQKKPMGGTIADFGIIMTGPIAAKLFILDLPLSLAADVVTLPYTIPYTIVIDRGTAGKDNEFSNQEKVTRVTVFHLKGKKRYNVELLRKEASRILKSISKKYHLEKEEGNDVYIRPDNQVILRLRSLSKAKNTLLISLRVRKIWENRKQADKIKKSIVQKFTERFGDHFTTERNVIEWSEDGPEENPKS